MRKKMARRRSKFELDSMNRHFVNEFNSNGERFWAELSENFWLAEFLIAALLLAIVPKFMHCTGCISVVVEFDWKMRFLRVWLLMIWPQKRKCWFDFRNHAQSHALLARQGKKKKILKTLFHIFHHLILGSLSYGPREIALRKKRLFCLI